MNIALALAAALSAASPEARPVEPEMLGRVIVRCVLKTDGLAESCEVEQETPPGLGLGPRALALAQRARYRRASEPRIVRIPISFPIIDLGAAPASAPP